jgi:hypothetical protein
LIPRIDKFFTVFKASLLKICGLSVQVPELLLICSSAHSLKYKTSSIIENLDHEAAGTAEFHYEIEKL